MKNSTTFWSWSEDSESQIMNLDLDLAALIQQVTEEIMLTIAFMCSSTGEKIFACLAVLP